MGKLMSGLGLCLVLGAVLPALAQDPFTIQSYEPSEGDASSFLEVPPAQSEPEAPIIQPIPIAKAETVYKPGPLKSRARNAQVRSVRTPAQEYIYQRAVYRAQQRTNRIELRKWRGESLLRPSHHSDHFWSHEYGVPGWYSSNTK
jgi:hypothetical protein